MATPVNPLDHLAIQNVLARYCEALDTKNWSLLQKVFVPDVQADYPFNRGLKGADAVADAIKNRLGPIRTHHSLTTCSVTFQPNKNSPSGKSATAVTYFVGCHFGQGPHEGKVLQAYGRYVDELEVQEVGPGGDYEGVQGASGVWRIRRREVGFTQRVGDEKIMKEF
ncbi:uncharacterized protein N0V89_012478 [Didymosphaeria variabile]|uniref:SnoaL-like domain-containing protein n=1 Tax=Didymosphaeria variabile TaxID=1932322 RepID=A0A9W8X995_9PLEO|nr:uncharacterized protein N0V89_012478 [Didymosphaeria variabile]KAJ4344734.1 hypothetical protein N0V89_012478 [Didymosphaeria variabile]